MGDRMHTPAILAIERDCGAAGFLGACIVTRLLQAESMHAQHIAVTGYGFIPMRQDAGDAIAQHRGVAQIEIAQMSELNGGEITRIGNGDATPLFDSTLVIAVMPGAQSRDMAAFAVI